MFFLMGPNSSYDRTENGIIINGTEYGPEIFGDDVPPHAIEYMWDLLDIKEVARGFDCGEEYGTDMLEDEVETAKNSYTALSDQEKLDMHGKKLRDLNEQIGKSEQKLEWVRLYSQGLLATLHGYRGPLEYKKVFENSIRRIVDDTEKRDFALRCDLDEEQEWCL